MAKEKAEPQEEGIQTRWEVSVFLKDAKGAKTCVKAVGDATVLDDIKTVTKAFYEDGFEADGGYQKPAPAPAATGSSGGTPEKKPCPVHEGSFLYRKTNAKGTWYSHKVGDGYCHGK